MAFTTLERQQVRTALGYPNTPLYPNAALESTLSAVDVDGESQIRTTLTELATIDTALLNAATKHLAFGRVDGDSEMKGAEEIEVLKREGSRRCEKIALILGFVRVGDPYRSTGGSSFMCLP